ncbi:MAG: ABC transporter substrate-binding protein [Nitrososphaerota archaeon]|nr:ABC transporter substrate-binding protein [Nitrososphaerota archaeon]
MRFGRIRAVARTFAALAIIIVIAVAAGGYYYYTNTTKPAVHTVYVAAFFPLSGGLSYFGKTCLDGAQLAAQDINQQGGIKALGGANITIIPVDTTSSATDAYSVVSNFLSTHHDISAAVGLYASGLTIPVLPLFQQNKVPLIHTAFSNIATSSNYTYGFRIAPNATVFGQSMVGFLNYLNSEYKSNLTRVAIVYENDAYGTGVAQAVQSALTQYPQYSVVLNEPYALSGFVSAQPVVSAIQAKDPQVILEVSYLSDAELIVSGLRSAGLNMPIIGGSGGFPLAQFGQALGSQTNGIFSAAAFNPLENKGIALTVGQEFNATYGFEMPEAAGSYYSAIWTIADAVSAAGSASPVTVNSELHSITVSSGGALILPESQIAFDSIGANVYAQPVIGEWQNGTFIAVYPLNLASSSIVPPSSAP